MKPRPIQCLIKSQIGAQRPTSSVQCHRSFHTYRPAILATLNTHETASKYHPHPSRTRLQPHNHRFYASSSTSTATATPKSSPSKFPPRSSLKPTKPAAQPTNTDPLPPLSDKLNPPPETYAPPLSLPDRQPGQSRLSSLLATGKAYLAFYKTGVKRVWTTRQLSATLRRKPSSLLTRSEWQVVLRSRRDMLRLPAFGVVLLLFGEWVPLLVMWLTPVVPEACRIPGQVERVVRGVEGRRRERGRRVGLDGARMLVPPYRDVRLGELGHLDLLMLSARLDGHGRVWDWLFLTPPKWVLRMGLGRKLEYLRKDDELIERDGGKAAWQRMGRIELERACVERGMDVLGKSEVELRKALAGWFSGGSV
ncbi:hypothetical protein EJ04DRAFT_460407 [Polyplosphaeria fusca]|uniref:Letm1 RBD domain-containing protein n=1 Tax=Polyplosphaeria fusca TaxID=682080 RepID=A0A9P4R2M5_9PLEO|nr:hypothetical protein EJ04DRAFT_460407 [Polyplosphaeria fusca]